MRRPLQHRGGIDEAAHLVRVRVRARVGVRVRVRVRVREASTRLRTCIPWYSRYSHRGGIVVVSRGLDEAVHLYTIV